MGRKYKFWNARSRALPSTYEELREILFQNREFVPVDKLEYGDHGLLQVIDTVSAAIRENRRIALYADYDVDGTMSCVSWIWFLKALGFSNFVHYIPCRIKEGYGLNLKAVERLITEERAEVIITMDTGITANEEAAYARLRGVEFICTDHHRIQPDKMPDCLLLNPKLHPDERYQELCGCGITFVLLRKLGERFSEAPADWSALWTDLLALVGMATICDVVPLNGVNHRLAKLGVSALMKSQRPVLRRLREASSRLTDLDESDVGFRLGPRINAVGRLEHADLVIRAFVEGDPEPLVAQMGECNERRRRLQAEVLAEARLQAQPYSSDPILFLGGDWHPGVVGIVAAKIAEEFWRPTFLFQRKDGIGKGSARGLQGFDVTEAMASARHHFVKFGGHTFAGGFTFEIAKEESLRAALCAHAAEKREAAPAIWESQIRYDCQLPLDLTQLELTDHLQGMKPFGNCFEEPRFCLAAEIARVEFYRDKQTGEPKHTALTLRGPFGRPQKLVFFNEVHAELAEMSQARFVVSASRNTFRGVTSLSLTGHDYEAMESLP